MSSDEIISQQGDTGLVTLEKISYPGGVVPMHHFKLTQTRLKWYICRPPVCDECLAHHVTVLWAYDWLITNLLTSIIFAFDVTGGHYVMACVWFIIIIYYFMIHIMFSKQNQYLWTKFSLENIFFSVTSKIARQ